MEQLREKFYRKVNRVSLDFVRHFQNEINWNSRMIGIRGARGVGKTTLLLQYIKSNLPINNKTIYVSLDDMYFTVNSLHSFVDIFVKKGGEYLFLDEVHRYKNWSITLKNIYDDFPDLKIVFTGSSILPLLKSKADLSRRAVMYDMTGLSFREYINLVEKKNLPSYSLDQILSHHLEISMEINSKVHPLTILENYNQIGYYPYFLEDKANYQTLLNATIYQSLEVDIPEYLQLNIESIEQMKMLLYIIAGSVPFKPNISKLSERTGISRNQIKYLLHYLNKAGIIQMLFSENKGISLLQKPEKIYLHHPNLLYALASENVNTGTIRETFFYNQVAHGNDLRYTKSGDFIVNDKYTFEVGGKNKTLKQIQDIKDAFVVADNIDYGTENKIPLYLFGFLY